MLILLYAAARQVGFEIATGYACPVILVLVPMLFLLPPQLVPAHVAAGLLVGALVARSRGRRMGARAVLAVGLSWHSVGPAFVFVCRRWGDEPGPRRLARIPPRAGRDVHHRRHGLVVRRPRRSTVKGGATGWTLAKDVDLRPTVVTKDAGWRLVQLRYVAATGATGDWLVDDVLIDPRMR